MQSWMKPFIHEGLDAYELVIAGKNYSYGEGVTLADFCLMPQLYNAERWGAEIVEFPKIARIMETLDQIPAFQNAHPDQVTLARSA